ncbi:AraC-like DNA-binding protein [Actinokineospora baliensis]|uniref:helix-turn-helix transcriptional regulator n=1 Tax=Actinokineospora baliensis TaxID=547056 RepID=UPI00195EA1B5|nr:helix-turn-helix transcriptional regulator [Actinokineospora baliensis]MBM7776462.1 AraC-like DNA-binding protein [Actinokineospora baliensis]
MADWSLVVAHRDIARVPSEHVFGKPDPRLAGLVLTYAAHTYPAATPPTPWRLTPLTVLTAVVDLETPRRRLPDGTDIPASPVLGLRDRPLDLEQAGESRGIGVTLTPPGAYALFGLPLRELTNLTVPLADLLRIDLLREQLAEAATWPDRFRLLDAYLLARLQHGPALTRPVEGAWRRMMSAPVSVGALAEASGWTRQHFHARFREQIGLAPRTVARIARLNRAALMLARPEPPPLAEVAHACGYVDQPHLNRDFRTLTGCTPTDYRPSR